jgi:hypothetical protein
LERKEKIKHHTQFINWRINGENQFQVQKPKLKTDWKLKMTKHPSVKSVPIEILMKEYGAIHFREAFAWFIVTILHNNISSAQLEEKAEDIFLPTRNLPVYHRIKFVDSDSLEVADSIHVQPKRTKAHNREMPARFDTVLVNNGRGKSIGIKGVYIQKYSKSIN